MSREKFHPKDVESMLNRTVYYCEEFVRGLITLDEDEKKLIDDSMACTRFKCLIGMDPMLLRPAAIPGGKAVSGESLKGTRFRSLILDDGYDYHPRVTEEEALEIRKKECDLPSGTASRIWERYDNTRISECIKAGDWRSAEKILESFRPRINDDEVRDEIVRSYLNQTIQGGNEMKTKNIVARWTSRRLEILNEICEEVRNNILEKDARLREIRRGITILNEEIHKIDPLNTKLVKMNIDNLFAGYEVSLAQALTTSSKQMADELSNELASCKKIIQTDHDEIMDLITAADTYHDELQILNTRNVLDHTFNLMIDTLQFDHIKLICTPD